MIAIVRYLKDHNGQPLSATPTMDSATLIIARMHLFQKLSRISREEWTSTWLQLSTQLFSDDKTLSTWLTGGYAHSDAFSVRFAMRLWLVTLYTERHLPGMPPVGTTPMRDPLDWSQSTIENLRDFSCNIHSNSTNATDQAVICADFERAARGLEHMGMATRVAAPAVHGTVH